MDERPRAPFRLYIITDRRHLRRGETLGSALAEALAAVPPGSTAVQLREKDLGDRELYALAEDLREVTEDFNALLFINGRPDIAVAVGADGVHLGFDAPPLAAVRRTFPDLQVGVSCHTLDELGAAADDDAAFATFSPVFKTSKTSFRTGANGELEPLPPHGVDGLIDAARRSRIPLVALGGVRLDSVRFVRDADVRSAACIAAVFGAMDRGDAARALVRVLAQE